MMVEGDGFRHLLGFFTHGETGFLVFMIKKQNQFNISIISTLAVLPILFSHLAFCFVCAKRSHFHNFR
ncbi:hypothetical protein HanRHA438_Chr11g0503491 [Helianthus annuus]|nr:hypothetical protein HanIR_Chr11g0528361 [Helianthus annuus]KAJ0870713.1 hypothetical protein HanRHA438_Chr11g0503491 [Helianthus annuus]